MCVFRLSFLVLILNRQKYATHAHLKIRPLALVFFCFSHRHEVASRTPSGLPKARVGAKPRSFGRKKERRSPYAIRLLMIQALCDRLSIPLSLVLN